ncbi:MAG: T9SS type A sorting domain-containing protein [Ignavibacteria bacterium]|nr:T9SS type A sorting domain-containing protein [Ignavibacteria bacterium]
MFLRYSSNLVIGAVIGNDTVISAEGDFKPGYIDNNGNPQGIDDPAYRVYKIVNGDTTGSDYVQWPGSQGAYVRNTGKTVLIGEQTLFSSCTDGYSNTFPMKAQILETDWVFDLNGPQGYTVFSEFRIINRSSNVWNNFYAGIYTDDDLGNATDDRISPDSSLNISYTYNSTNNDGVYGAAPPAISFNVLSGNISYTGSNNDSVILYRPVTSNNRIVKRGYKNLYLTSYNPFLNGNPLISPPVNDREYFNVLQGLKKDGSVWINSMTNLPTGFPDQNFGAGDFKFLISSGPANVNPGDTQTIIVAQLVAKGANNLQSITSLKSGSSLIRNLFENNFGTVSVSDPGISELPVRYKLYQNYPNPFNPVTKIKFDLSKSGSVRLVIYDISGKEIFVLYNGYLTAGEKEFAFDGSGFSSGIYFYKLTAGSFSETKKIILNK